MYRPNRIGPHPIFEPSVHLHSLDTTSFESSSASPFYPPYVMARSSAVPDDFNNVHIGKVNLTIPHNKGLCIGAPISGKLRSGVKGYFYSLSGHVSCYSTDGSSEMLVFPFIGQGDSGSVSVVRTTKVNRVQSFYPVPMRSESHDNGIVNASVNETIVVSEMNPASGVGMNGNPIWGAWMIFNCHDADDIDMSFHLSVGIHRWTSDLAIYDPYR